LPTELSRKDGIYLSIQHSVQGTQKIPSLRVKQSKRELAPSLPLPWFGMVTLLLRYTLAFVTRDLAQDNFYFYTSQRKYNHVLLLETPNEVPKKWEECVTKIRSNTGLL
jgi:hypothetical protein